MADDGYMEEEEDCYDYDDGPDTAQEDGAGGAGAAAAEKQITVLLIGQSGSGKSTTSKEIIASTPSAKGRRVYVLLKHGKKEEENQPEGWHRIGFHNLPEISHCALVVEDVLSSSKQEFEDLKEVLHYSNHHRRVNPVIMICHSLHNTGSIYALLPGFSFIYLAARQTSINSMKSVLRYFQFEPSEKLMYLRQLTSCREKYAHFVLNVDTRKMHLQKAGDSSGGVEKEKKTESKVSLAKTNAAKYMALLADKDKCMAIFDLLINHIPEKQLNPHNLTVSLRKDFAGKRRSSATDISIIDYIAALTKDDFHAGLEETDPLLLKFHHYLHRKAARLPNCFISNRRFRQTPD